MKEAGGAAPCGAGGGAGAFRAGVNHHGHVHPRRRDGDVPADGSAAGGACAGAADGLPGGAGRARRAVAFYRYLYNTVGADYVWWLRRTMSDDELAALLRDPLVSIHVLYCGGEPAGFFELDARGWPDINLSYFGLMPHAIGTGVGYRVPAPGGGCGVAAGSARDDGEHLHRRPSARVADLSARRDSARCARCARCGTCRCVLACGFRRVC